MSLQIVRNNTCENWKQNFSLKANDGLPEAELFEEDYDGAPVVGEYLTILPNVASLPEGNRVHNVRVDILAQQL